MQLVTIIKSTTRAVASVFDDVTVDVRKQSLTRMNKATLFVLLLATVLYVQAHTPRREVDSKMRGRYVRTKWDEVLLQQ